MVAHYESQMTSDRQSNGLILSIQWVNIVLHTYNPKGLYKCITNMKNPMEFPWHQPMRLH